MTRWLSSSAWALIAATLIIAHQVAGKATRDAIFLSQFEATKLPKIVLIAAILSILAVVVIARFLANFGPWRVITGAFLISALLFIVDWLAFPSAQNAVAIAIYLQMAVFGAVLISGFWSVINERFDPYTAKQTIARIGAAATLGGVLGGVLAGQVAAAIDLRAMLLVLSILHVACAAAVRAIGEGKRAVATNVPAGFSSGVRLLLDHRYLQWMAAVMVLLAMLAGILDYAFKSQAAAELAGGEALAAFFGKFYAAVGVLTFVVQSLLGPPMLKRFGIGVTLAVMPILTIGIGFATTLAPRLGTVVAMRAAQMAGSNSFFRSAFELLYTPLPPLTKRPTKAIIDVGSDRLGDMLGSGLLIVLLAVFVQVPSRMLAVIAIGLALGMLFAVHRLHRGYIEQLATSLRAGAISLSEDEIIDATTRTTLAEASPASERELLMARIRQLRQARGRVPDPITPRASSAEVLVADPNAEALAKATADIASGDLGRIRQCLHGGFMDPRLVPMLLPLLAHDTLAEDIRMELRWMAPQIIGTLGDAIANPDLPIVARQRLPSVLEVVHSPRATAVLMDALEEEEFIIRYSAARALARMHARDSYMRIDSASIFAAVQREVNADHAAWTANDLEMNIDLPGDMIAMSGPGDSRLNFSMEHVFTLLGLVLDREALSLALHAVMSTDRNLSGTALEYLENVLPEEVRRGLWPRLHGLKFDARSNRGIAALEADLKRGPGI
jgi:ATP:ADP antiporter, AAA family